MQCNSFINKTTWDEVRKSAPQQTNIANADMVRLLKLLQANSSAGNQERGCDGEFYWQIGVLTLSMQYAEACGISNLKPWVVGGMLGRMGLSERIHRRTGNTVCWNQAQLNVLLKYFEVK